MESRPLLPYASQIENCTACGLCLPVCPVFAQTGLEVDGPRGRLAIASALAHQQIEHREAVAAFSRCLSCGKCDGACPARIPLTAIFLACRQILFQILPVSHKRRLLFRSLARWPRIWDFLQPPLSLLQKLLKRRLKSGRPMPEIAFEPFWILAKTERAHGPVTLLFSGCITRRIFPTTARTCTITLEQQGNVVIAPAELVCCGRPLALQGDISALVTAVRKNLAILAKYDFEWLATPCPGCLTTLKNIWPTLVALTTAEKKQVQELAVRCRDINELLGKPPPSAKTLKIFWHRPCLMEARAEAVALKMLGQPQSDDPISCCGAPLGCFEPEGTRNYKPRPDVLASLRKKHTLAEALARHIRSEAVSADCIVTSCPGCMLALRNATALPTLHIVDLYKPSIHWPRVRW